MRGLLLFVLILADLAAWGISLLANVAENCDNGVSRLECSSFAQDVAPVLGVVGVIAIVALLGSLLAHKRAK